MEKVLGIGGVFFKAAIPRRRGLVQGKTRCAGRTGPNLRLLRVERTRRANGLVCLRRRHEILRRRPAPFMFNYGVRNLDAMLAQLRAVGVRVEEKVEEYDYGRFGWAYDPEGNRLELWEPKQS